MFLQSLTCVFDRLFLIIVYYHFFIHMMPLLSIEVNDLGNPIQPFALKPLIEGIETDENCDAILKRCVADLRRAIEHLGVITDVSSNASSGRMRACGGDIANDTLSLSHFISGLNALSVGERSLAQPCGLYDPSPRVSSQFSQIRAHLKAVLNYLSTATQKIPIER